jgi:hypothetical protein
LRKAAKRTVEGLWVAIGRLIDLFEPNDAETTFAAATTLLPASCVSYITPLAKEN